MMVMMHTVVHFTRTLMFNRRLVYYDLQAEALGGAVKVTTFRGRGMWRPLQAEQFVDICYL